MATYRIAILGMGGVGGYLGGMLAAAAIKDTAIIFIARTQTKDTIKEKGLTLIVNDTTKVVRPHLVSDDPNEIGHLDLLICSVKGYDLENSLLPYRSCLTNDSVILPFLNGIGIDAKIKKFLPGVRVWEGCIYIIARQLEKGVIKVAGGVDLFFGSPAASKDELRQVKTLFDQAGIKTTVPDNIEAEMWRKFLFISVMATATSYYNSAIGDIRNDPEKNASLGKMLDELDRVATATGVSLPPNIIATIEQRIAGLAPDATSSMYADFQKGGNTELEELTGDVIRLGQQTSTPTPIYEKMYSQLKTRRP
jgi:2-dehydropantoate 2-reductase